MDRYPAKLLQSMTLPRFKLPYRAILASEGNADHPMQPMQAAGDRL